MREGLDSIAPQVANVLGDVVLLRILRFVPELRQGLKHRGDPRGGGGGASGSICLLASTLLQGEQVKHLEK
jgi:hypothetical protein